MGKSRGHDRGAILDSVFSPPSSDENRTHASYKILRDDAHLSAVAHGYGTDSSSHRGTLTFICPEGSPFWSRLLSAPPTGVNTLGRRSCFRLSLCLRRVISSDKRRGGALPSPSAGESLSPVARHTSCLAGTARQRRPLHGSDLQVAAHWGVSPSQNPGTSLPGRTASLRGPGEQTAGHIKSLQVR